MPLQHHSLALHRAAEDVVDHLDLLGLVLHLSQPRLLPLRFSAILGEGLQVLVYEPAYRRAPPMPGLPPATTSLVQPASSSLTEMPAAIAHEPMALKLRYRLAIRPTAVLDLKV